MNLDKDRTTNVSLAFDIVAWVPNQTGHFVPIQ